MTAVLPPVRPVPAGRHRAPDAATTGSLGPIPQEWTGRAAHVPGAADPAPSTPAPPTPARAASSAPRPFAPTSAPGPRR